MESKINPIPVEVAYSKPNMLERIIMLPKTLAFREEGKANDDLAILLALAAVTAMMVFTLYKQLERGNTSIPFLQ